ncbi:MAG: hypothetical protein ACXW1R_07315, partial [Halobacteriota archaeon]
FTAHEQSVNLFGVAETLPASSAACALWGVTLLVYINSERRDTFGDAGVRPCRYRLYGQDGSVQVEEGPYLEGRTAEMLRFGQFRRVDVVLAR